jgi:hypothetical protein
MIRRPKAASFDDGLIPPKVISVDNPQSLHVLVEVVVGVIFF